MQLSNVQAYAGAGTRQKFCTSRIYEAHGVWVEQEGVTMERKIDQDKLEKRLVEAMREATGLEGEKRSPHGLALG